MTAVLRNRFQTDGVASISQERLLLALYDRVVTDLDGAAAAIRGNKPAEAHEKLVHAQEILEELHLALDQQAWDGAENLASLYQYAIERLIAANLRKDLAPVLEVKALIEPLAASWREAFEQLTGARAVAATVPQPAAAGARRFEAGA
jgi:flagellar secretion chaperone FliS